MTQIYSYLKLKKYLLSWIPQRTMRMAARIWKKSVRYLKLSFNPSNKDCESVHRYLKWGNSKSPSWWITYLRFILLGSIIGMPWLIQTNKLLKEVVQMRLVQVSNLLISYVDNIFLYTSSFYIGRMVQLTLNETNEKQIIKILEDVASNPSIDSTFNNMPIILFLLTVGLTLGAIWIQVNGIQIINGQVIPDDIVTRVSLNIPGPMTELDMIKVDDFLRNQALIDNLMISPIGELWPDQW